MPINRQNVRRRVGQ